MVREHASVQQSSKLILVLQFKQDTTKRMAVRLDELGLTYGYIKEQYGALTREEFGQLLHVVGLSQKKWVCKITDHLRDQVKTIMPSPHQINDVLQFLVAAWYSVRGTNATNAFLKATICIKTFNFITNTYSFHTKNTITNTITQICI